MDKEKKEVTRFTIYKVHNGYLLNIYKGGHMSSYVYNEKERLVMFARIDEVLGDMPQGSVGMTEHYS